VHAYKDNHIFFGFVILLLLLIITLGFKDEGRKITQFYINGWWFYP